MTNCFDCKHCVRMLVDSSRRKSAEECAPICCEEMSQPIVKIGNGDGTMPFGADCPMFDRDEP